VKTIALTLRGCPPEVHQALKARAKANRRSLNSQALTELEHKEEPVKGISGAEMAKRLRAFKAQFTEKEFAELAELTQEAIEHGRHARLP
jgi:hypothetical protein